jgi:hypothetical protein
LAVVSELNLLSELVVGWVLVGAFGLVRDDARSGPFANQKGKRGQLKRQTFGKNEQLLLALEKLVENESRNGCNRKASNHQKAGEENLES